MRPFRRDTSTARRAVVAHLGQNTVMRLRNIGGAADFQNVSRAIRYRQIQMDGISPESTLRPHTPPAFLGIVHKILYFSIRIGGKGVFGACEPITIRCAALAILLYTPVCGYLIVRILLPIFPYWAMARRLPPWKRRYRDRQAVRRPSKAPPKTQLPCFPAPAAPCANRRCNPESDRRLAVCHMSGQTL